jgi:hypothetical protein
MSANHASKPMQRNLENLSSQELFELARKRLQQEQEDARRAEMIARTAELRKRNEDMLAQHRHALAELDKELQALQQRREKLLAEHQRAIAELARELQALESPLNQAAAPAVPSRPVPEPSVLAAATPAFESKPVTPAPARDDHESPLAATAPAVETRAAAPSPARQDNDSEVSDAVVEAMRGRNDISESLLREKLRNKGISVSDLHKHLEKMVRAGTIVSRGGGNYSLKKKN